VPASLSVEIAYALPERQVLLRLELAAGATVADALAAALAIGALPAIADDQPVGIFGRVVARSELLAPGDRLEIYRPLAADPKATRRRLAREGLSIGGRGGKR
jgi:putative ubiquitin-RnfH superfamily antitoxin RatB of RatAB toxin-antitoxin module